MTRASHVPDHAGNHGEQRATDRPSTACSRPSAEAVAPTAWKIRMTNVAPLGIFGRIASQSAFSENANELRQRVGAISEEERGRIVEYLRSGTPIIALMGFSEDVLGNRFSR